MDAEERRRELLKIVQSRKTACFDELMERLSVKMLGLASKFRAQALIQLAELSDFDCIFIASHIDRAAVRAAQQSGITSDLV